MSSNQTHVDAPVVVVGGGPVGCTLSIALSNLGIANVVIERDVEIHPLPRAILIDGELERALIQLGLGAGLAPLLTPMRTAEYVDVNGVRLAGQDIPDKSAFGGLAPASVHFQPDIEALLRREVVARGARLITGALVTGVEHDSGGVTVHIDGQPDVRADFLVGCDGASSTVRRSTGIAWEDLGFDQDWLVVDIQVNDRATCGLPDVARQICDPQRPVTMISGHDRYYRWELQLQPGEDPQQVNTPENVWAMLSTWITPDKARLVRSATYRFHAVVASTMRVGRVMLAGDAGHQMPPFMGQGLNSGMRDAVNLAWKLKWVIEGWSRDGLLDTYSTERRTHAKQVVEQSVEAGRLIDQYAGRASHGIATRATYGGRRPDGYHEGVVVGDSTKVGRPYPWWHQVADGIPTSATMTLVSAAGASVELPTTGGPWRRVDVDRTVTFGADFVVVRPDGWVAAVCAADEIDQTLTVLATRLAG